MPCFDKPTADRVERRAFLTRLDEEISQVMIYIVGAEEKKSKAFSRLADVPTAVQNQCQALASMLALSSLMDEGFSEVKISLTKAQEDLAILKSIYMPPQRDDMPPQSADMPTAAQNQRQTASGLLTLVHEEICQVRISMTRIEEHIAKVIEIAAGVISWRQ